ncbi:class I SAM-dependent methyltransferase [Arachidicoccus sp.]|uniref:class I SAM-dependent methyltransferase n=1 Tax=Arachidicoccus sp. TaxID=1872624 RepID=UPI003D263601
MFENAHNKEVINQFTLQAVPFTEKTEHSDALQLLVDLAQTSAQDTVLDVACGPGLVLCAFAKIARRTTGIDITPAMLEQAKKRQGQAGLENMQWDLGNAERLPYPDGSFSIVVSRYSFHHFEHPEKILREMYRVCQNNGRILIADFTLPEENLPAFNAMEKLRDSSHEQALSLQAFLDMFKKCGMKEIDYTSYNIDMKLEDQLTASFPNDNDTDTIRRLFKEDLKEDKMGIKTRLINNEMHFTYPINVYIGNK